MVWAAFVAFASFVAALVGAGTRGSQVCMFAGRLLSCVAFCVHTMLISLCHVPLHEIVIEHVSVVNVLVHVLSVCFSFVATFVCAMFSAGTVGVDV
jgi:hypothetical protein